MTILAKHLGSVQTNKDRRQSSSGWRLHLCVGDDEHRDEDDDGHGDDDGVDYDESGIDHDHNQYGENLPICSGNDNSAPRK